MPLTPHNKEPYNISATAALVFSLIVFGLHVAAYFFPDSLNWGYHYLGFLSPYALTVYSVVICLSLFIVIRGSLDPVIAKLGRRFDDSPLTFLGIAIVIVGICGWMLRVRTPLLGDSFYLIRNFFEAFHGTETLYPRDEPLATYYFSTIIEALGASSFQQFLDRFFIAEMLLCCGFIINIFMIVRMLFAKSEPRMLTFLMVLCIPYMQLFFGYIEVYAVVLFVVSIYINIAVHSLRKKISFSMVPPAFLLTALTHYATMLMIPSLLYLTYLEWKLNRMKHITLGYGIAAGALLFILLGISFDLENFSSWVPYSHFLSISQPGNITDRYSQAYTLFSFYHFNDLLNLLLLMASGSIFFMGFSLIQRGFHRTIDQTDQFLILCLIGVILFLCVVKFDLGTARDWDVFAPYFFILTLLSCSMFFRTSIAHPLRAFVNILVMVGINSWLYIYGNSTTDASVKRFTSLFDKRVLSQNGFYGASLTLSQYYHQVKNFKEPITIWQRYAELFPSDERGFQNTINNIMQRGTTEDSLLSRTFELWHEAQPSNRQMLEQYISFCFDAGSRLFTAGDLRAAELHYSTITVLDSSQPKAYNNLGSVYAQDGNLHKAVTMFNKAITLDSSYVDPYYNLGNAYIDSGERGRGIKLLQHAAQSGHRAAQQTLQQQGISW